VACEVFFAPEARDNLRPGLRVIGFERRVTIAFHITSDRITIDRVLYGGRDLKTTLTR